MVRKINLNKKWLGLVGIILLCTLLVIVVTAYRDNRRLVDENNHLQNKIVRLEIIVDVSESENDDLQVERNILEAEISRLEGEVAEIGNLEAEISRLEDDIERLDRHLYFWENTYYMSYIMIDEGYALVGYTYHLGDRYDFHIYLLEWYLDPDDLPEDMRVNRVEVVVLKNNEVVGILSRNSPWSSRDFPTDFNLFIELPDQFNGQHGVVIRNGGIGSFSLFDLYLEYQGELVNIPSFSNILSPSFDFENQVVRSVSPHYLGSNAIRIHRLVDGTFIEVERLIMSCSNCGVEEHAQILVEGEWQINEHESQWEYWVGGNNLWFMER